MRVSPVLLDDVAAGTVLLVPDDEPAACDCVDGVESLCAAAEAFCEDDAPLAFEPLALGAGALLGPRDEDGLVLAADDPPVCWLDPDGADEAP